MELFLWRDHGEATLHCRERQRQRDGYLNDARVLGNGRSEEVILEVEDALLIDGDPRRGRLERIDPHHVPNGVARVARVLQFLHDRRLLEVAALTAGGHMTQHVFSFAKEMLSF